MSKMLIFAILLSMFALTFAILESMFALIFAIDYDIIYLINPLKGDWNEKILDGEA